MVTDNDTNIEIKKMLKVAFRGDMSEKKRQAL